jgi:hypothetical protein
MRIRRRLDIGFIPVPPVDPVMSASWNAEQPVRSHRQMPYPVSSCIVIALAMDGATPVRATSAKPVEENVVEAALSLRIDDLKPRLTRSGGATMSAVWSSSSMSNLLNSACCAATSTRHAHANWWRKCARRGRRPDRMTSRTGGRLLCVRLTERALYIRDCVSHICFRPKQFASKFVLFCA